MNADEAAAIADLFTGIQRKAQQTGLLGLVAECKVRAKEWNVIASLLDDFAEAGEPVEIVPVGTVAKGQEVYKAAHPEGFHAKIRSTGPADLMLENVHTGQPMYLNRYSENSPVVVKR